MTSSALMDICSFAVATGDAALGGDTLLLNPYGTEGLNDAMFISTNHVGTIALHPAAAIVASQDVGGMDLADEITTMLVTRRAHSATGRVSATTARLLNDLARLAG